MRFTFISIALLIIILTAGCAASDNNPMSPQNSDPDTSPQVSGNNSDLDQRHLWGYWSVAIDRSTGDVEVLPLRTANFNANVTQFLAPPFSPTLLLSIKILPETDLPNGYADLEIGLRHPFPELNQFKGFDVRTIFMADGTQQGEHDPAIIFSALENDEAVMLNPDGYTRWWNSTEFTDPHPVLSYRPFIMGTLPFPSATLNPYKYFADDLGFDDDVADMTIDNRGVFTNSFDSLTRNFKIQFPTGPTGPKFLFNMAVDASWAKPDDAGAPDYPIASFPPAAQVQEAYHLSVNTSDSDLWYVDGFSGGCLVMKIEVFDWQSLVNPDGVEGEISAIWIESPILVEPIDILPFATVSPGSKFTSAVIEGVICDPDVKLSDHGEVHLQGSIESDYPESYQPQIPFGENYIYPVGPLAAYFITTVEIVEGVLPTITVTVPNGGEVWDIGMSQEITWTSDPGIENVNIFYSKDDFVSDINIITLGAPNTGTYTWDPIPDDPSGTVKIRVEHATVPEIFDDSDDYFTIYEGLGCEFTNAHSYSSFEMIDAHLVAGYSVLNADPSRIVAGRQVADGQDAWPWLAIYDDFDLSTPIATFQVPGWANTHHPWHYEPDSTDRIYFFMDIDHPPNGNTFETVYYIDWNGEDFVEPSFGSIDLTPFIDSGEKGVTIFVDSHEDLYVVTTTGRMLKFDPSDSYSATEIFNLASNPDYPQSKELDFVYDEINDWYFIYVGYGGGLRAIYKISNSGDVLASDTDLYSELLGGWWCGYVSGGIGLDSDCRLVVIDGAMAGWGCIRYDADLHRKAYTFQEWNLDDELFHPGHSLTFNADDSITFNTAYYNGAHNALITYSAPADW